MGSWLLSVTEDTVCRLSPSACAQHKSRSNMLPVAAILSCDTKDCTKHSTMVQIKTFAVAVLVLAVACSQLISVSAIAQLCDANANPVAPQKVR